jgi:hypothetical protein
MTWTPTLQTRQNWHNHFLNKIIVRKVFFFRADSSTKRFTSLTLSLSLTHGITSPAMRIPPRAFQLVNGLLLQQLTWIFNKPTWRSVMHEKTKEGIWITSVLHSLQYYSYVHSSFLPSFRNSDSARVSFRPPLSDTNVNAEARYDGNIQSYTTLQCRWAVESKPAWLYCYNSK